MAETVDDLTVQYSEGGIDIVEELEKHVLSKGAWSTVMFKYREWDRRKEEYSAPKVSIRRYQKREGQFFQKSKFNISSEKQAKEIISTLQNWFPES